VIVPCNVTYFLLSSREKNADVQPCSNVHTFVIVVVVIVVVVFGNILRQSSLARRFPQSRIVRRPISIRLNPENILSFYLYIYIYFF
jgi:hypothetical protein